MHEFVRMTNKNRQRKIIEAEQICCFHLVDFPEGQVVGKTTLLTRPPNHREGSLASCGRWFLCRPSWTLAELRVWSRGGGCFDLKAKKRWWVGAMLFRDINEILQIFQSGVIFGRMAFTYFKKDTSLNLKGHLNENLKIERMFTKRWYVRVFGCQNLNFIESSAIACEQNF